MISTLDSDRFGFLVAKCNQWDKPVEETLRAYRQQGVRLVITRLAAEDIPAINALEAAGFEIKDMQVTYGGALATWSTPLLPFPHDVCIREACATDLECIASIAKASFKNYGHYYRNPRLDTAALDTLYEDWAVRSFKDEGFADKFFVALANNEVAGFVTLINYQANGTACAKAGLGAVAVQYRNKKIYQLLVQHALLWGKAQGHVWQEYNALATNYPAAKVYTRAGLHSAATWVTLHGWLA